MNGEILISEKIAPLRKIKAAYSPRQAGQTSIHVCSWRVQALLQMEICRGVPVQRLMHAWNWF
jgi:hypothetical protein